MMHYRLLHDYVIVADDIAHPIARARGDDAIGWMAMSVTDVQRPRAKGRLFPSLRDALRQSVEPSYWGEIDKALAALRSS